MISIECICKGGVNSITPPYFYFTLPKNIFPIDKYPCHMLP